MTPASCHPERYAQAHGLCLACYNRARYAAGKRRGVGRPATCHPERIHVAKGMCNQCYMRSYNRDDGTKHVARRRTKTDEEIRLSRNARQRIHNTTPEARAYFADWRRKWRAANPEKCLELTREYRARNPDKVVSMHQRRRARLLDACSPGVTPEQWNAELKRAGGACVYCGTHGVKLTRDHVIPLSRGGRDEPSNVVPACRSCNSIKSNRTDLEFVAYLETLARIGQLPRQFRKAG